MLKDILEERAQTGMGEREVGIQIGRLADEITERVGGSISDMGAGTPGIARHSSETRSTYTNPRHTPIELNMRR